MPRPKEFSPDNALLAAMQLFREKGYTATSMEDLVQAMGINRASLYNTFGNKHDLYMQALKVYWASVLMPPFQAFAASGNMMQTLAGFEEISGCFLLGCMSELAASDPEVAEFSAACFADLESMLRSAVAEERANGLWPHVQSDAEAASLLLACLVGMRLLGKANLAFHGHLGMKLLARTLVAKSAKDNVARAVSNGTTNLSDTLQVEQTFVHIRNKP